MHQKEKPVMIMRKSAFLFAYLIPCLLVIGYLLGGPFHFVTPVFVFGFIPLLDLLVGSRTVNESEAAYTLLKKDLYFRWIIWLYVPVQVALVVWGAYVAGSGSLSPLALTGFVLSMGLVTGGIGITLAHELGHRAGPWEQGLAKTLLMTVCYMHFFIEHNLGHHARVATPHDPASARLGESFYKFFPRTLMGGFQHAWQLECRRLARRNQKKWSIHNQMVRFVLLPLMAAVLLGLVFGWPATFFFFAQSAVAFSLLELVNYVEHYGLARREIAPGRFEKVTPLHSWNASEVITNYLLFNLQKHSDHHANANRRYQTLRHADHSPQLPTGYAGMILLALVPALWYKVMDPKALALTARE